MLVTREDISLVYYDVVKPDPYIPRPLRIMESITSTSLYDSVGMHVREPCYDFHYILSGSGEVTYKNRLYSVEPGQAFIWHSEYPKLNYHYSKDASEPWRFISFCFMQNNLLSTFKSIISNSPVFTIPPEEPVIKLFSEHTRRNGRIIMSCAEGAEIVYKLLITLMRYSNIYETKEFHPLINKTEKIISSSLNKNISITEIAAELGVSREYLSRIFHEYTGEKMKDYITKLRIEAARNYLFSTNKSISEIAELLNYSTPSNFARDFNSIMGVTPSEYRKVKKLCANERAIHPDE